MIRLKTLFTILMVFVMLAISIHPLTANDKIHDNNQIHLQKSVFGKPFLGYDDIWTEHFEFTVDDKDQNKKRKSPMKGLLFSALIPGSGEMYAKSWWKGLLFLGIEAGSWVAYAHYHNQGKDLEDEFMAYADSLWDEQMWRYWWENKTTEDYQSIHAHHDLPDTKTQQYYEMIGKYQKFNAGWQDIWIDDRNFSGYDVDTDTSQLSLEYMDMRDKSNQKFKMATTATTVVLVNHVLSALDAVWTVNQYNQKVESSVRVKYATINNRPVLMTNLKLKW